MAESTKKICESIFLTYLDVMVFLVGNCYTSCSIGNCENFVIPDIRTWGACVFAGNWSYVVIKKEKYFT